MTPTVHCKLWMRCRVVILHLSTHNLLFSRLSSPTHAHTFNAFFRWAICKSAPCSRQTTTLAPHHSVFYRPDALPAAQPTASKHWRHYHSEIHIAINDKSQGSIGKNLRCDELLHYTFIIHSAGEKIFKIGKLLAKLRAKSLTVSYTPFALHFCPQ